MQEVCLLSVLKTTTERGDYEDGGCELKLKHCTMNFLGNKICRSSPTRRNLKTLWPNSSLKSLKKCQKHSKLLGIHRGPEQEGG